MQRFARLAAYVPTVLVVIGFILIFMGWNGAAGVDYTQGQIPYLISGGLVGLAFVFFGASGVIIQAIRRAQTIQEEILKDMAANMARMVTALSLGSNGDVNNGETVIAGSTSFHLAGCRMVEGKAGVVRVPREEAVAEGLEPCRICEP